MTWNALTEVAPKGNITCESNITGQHDRILQIFISSDGISNIAFNINEV